MVVLKNTSWFVLCGVSSLASSRKACLPLILSPPRAHKR
jgi:hypothetical protein